MNTWKRVQLSLAVILISGSAARPAQTDLNTLAWGDPVNGLEISLYTTKDATPTPVVITGSNGEAITDLYGHEYTYPDLQEIVASSNAPMLRLALRNIGSSEITVQLGGRCGSGPIRTNGISLLLTDAQGKSKRLDFRPWEVGCGGSNYGFSLSIPPGKSFSLLILLDYYWGWEEPSGAYSLQAILESATIAEQQLPMKVRSNVLQVQFPAQ
jgi:hypothetical protein